MGLFSNADGKVVIDTQLNTNDFEKGLSKIQSTTQKAGNTIKSIIVGLGITKLVSMAMNQITGSIDDAITRIDTLNQFPKVMSNLGISAEESQEAIDKMADKLAGLPTTLDQGARAVQRFTSKNGNVKKSTDLFLALNNAILAGGASSEIQASALEQLSQAYAKGKPDMMEWRTAMTAMPAQLKQVARAMGYIDADALGEALRDGSVSMDEFMETIERLNTEGIDGFQNFEQQARNSTGGIKTSIQVAKTQVVKGVADIINALNTKMGESGAGSISDYISNIGKSSKKALDTFAKLITGEISPKEFGEKAVELVTKFIEKATEEFPKILELGINIVTELAKGMAEGIPKLMDKTAKLILSIPQTIEEHLDEILEAGGIILLKLAEGFEKVYPKAVEAVSKLEDKLLEKLEDPEFLGKLILFGSRISFSIQLGLLKALPSLLSNIYKIPLEIIRIVGEIPSKMWEIGVQAIRGFINGWSSEVGNLKQRMINGIQGAVDAVKAKLKIHSPSRVFRDELGKQSALGYGIGFEEEIKNVYRDMQHAIDIEQNKLQANVETGKVFNTLANTTPVAISVIADVEMDSQKVGRLVTPTVTRTIKNGGGV